MNKESAKIKAKKTIILILAITSTALIATALNNKNPGVATKEHQPQDAQETPREVEHQSNLWRYDTSSSPMTGAIKKTATIEATYMVSRPEEDVVAEFNKKGLSGVITTAIYPLLKITESTESGRSIEITTYDWTIGCKTSPCKILAKFDEKQAKEYTAIKNRTGENLFYIKENSDFYENIPVSNKVLISKYPHKIGETYIEFKIENFDPSKLAL